MEYAGSPFSSIPAFRSSGTAYLLFGAGGVVVLEPSHAENASAVLANVLFSESLRSLFLMRLQAVECQELLALISFN